MKTYLTIFMIFCLAIKAAYSQEVPASKVPAAVKQAFTKKFPSAKGIKYIPDNNDYKISFTDQGKSCIATYSSSGKIAEIDREISPASLPKAVSASIATKFRGYTTMTVVKREATDMGICYEADLKKDDEGYSVRFSEQGEILQKEARKVEFRVVTKPQK